MGTTMNWNKFISLTPEQQQAKTLRVLAEVVTEAGSDFRYISPQHDGGQCYYVYDRGNGRKADCIAGRVYARLGLTLDQLRALEKNAASSVAEKYGAHESVGRILTSAQGPSDQRVTWGRVLKQVVAQYPVTFA